MAGGFAIDAALSRSGDCRGIYGSDRRYATELWAVPRSEEDAMGSGDACAYATGVELMVDGGNGEGDRSHHVRRRNARWLKWKIGSTR